MYNRNTLLEKHCGRKFREIARAFGLLECVLSLFVEDEEKGEAEV